MKVRIYQPSPSATQSGKARKNRWRLEYPSSGGRWIEPLMGWTASSNTRAQLDLWFPAKEAAIAYAERNGLAYEALDPPKPSEPETRIYADNFRFCRSEPWTH